MKIRRYVAKSAQEALLKVKMDLGNEAMILNTRKIRQGGFLGIFSTSMVEVLAALDEYDRIGNKRSGLNEVVKQSDEKKKEEENITEEKEGKINYLENKVMSMEKTLQNIYNQFKSTDNRNENIKIEENKNHGSTKIVKLFYNNLIKHEVSDEIADQIIKEATENIQEENYDIKDVASMMYSHISDILGKPETIRFDDEKKPLVAIFIGPTGVGKTTTLAKIAAEYSLNSNKNVALITADTYRIAAVDQLKTYAEIMGMPLSVIYSPGEVKDILEKYNDKDLVLIDTAGRSSKNKVQFDELDELLKMSGADEVYLLISATTSIRNSMEILKSYSFLKDYKLIFTKIDETSAMGTILNVSFITGKKLSYITNGQSVPDDIEVASIDSIVKNLLGSIA